MNLRITATTWMSVWNVLQRSFTHPLAPEWGVIGLLGASRSETRPALLVAESVTPTSEDFRLQTRYGLSFDRSYVRRAILHARSRASGSRHVSHTPGVRRPRELLRI
jgi:hypothetical protein